MMAGVHAARGLLGGLGDKDVWYLIGCNEVLFASERPLTLRKHIGEKPAGNCLCRSKFTAEHNRTSAAYKAPPDRLADRKCGSMMLRPGG